MDDSIKLKISDFKESLFGSYKYWTVYLLLVLMAVLSVFSAENYSHPKFEVFIIILVSIIGIFFIVYFYRHGHNELYKTAFVILLLFGLICAFTIPIDSVSDEYEHLTRAEMTSRGVLFPDYSNGHFESIESLPEFYKNSTDKTVFDINNDHIKINNSMASVDSAFEQNPFYGYIFSAIGIGIAKLLDLNVIWMLWLGRIFNVFLYAGLISLAIKKTPIHKMKLFAIACLPVCLFQAFSLSIDSLLAGLGIFTVAYFFNMCVNEFDRKEIAVFSMLCLITALCKLPYLGLILLLLFVPAQNCREKNYILYSIISMVLISALAILWNNFYASPALLHSWRGEYFIQNNVSVSNQWNFILSHPKDFLAQIFSLIYSIPPIFTGFFNFYAYTVEGGTYVGSEIISVLLTLFVAFVSLYPSDVNTQLKTRIGTLITFIIIYVGTFVVQLLSWNPAGQLTFNGVHTRYFIVLFALLPLIFSIYKSDYKNEKLEKYAFVLILFFISSMIISIATKFY